MRDPEFYGKSIADMLPFDLGRVALAQLQRQRTRQGNRAVKRFIKAQSYRAAALAGGGSREVARRMCQIAAGRLQVSA